MKTLETLYQEVLADEKLKKGFFDAMKENREEEFLRANGCEAEAAEIGDFLLKTYEKQGELADEELDSVAGGCGYTHVPTYTHCPHCREYPEYIRWEKESGPALCVCRSCKGSWYE